MAEYTALTPLFDDIADAIRYKDGTTADIVANTFPERIRAIPSASFDSALESVAVANPPMQTDYLAGETFNPAGMVVVAAFSDGSEAVIDHSVLTFTPSGPLSTTDTQITISLTIANVTKTTAQAITVATQHVIGVMWNSANPSTALTRLTKANDPNGLVSVDITEEPVPAVGTSAGSSPFDAYLPWKGMEEYNIVNNAVTYKRGDAGFSRSAYDTLVYIPEYWYKVILDGENQYYYVSDIYKDGFEKHPGSGKYVGRYTDGVNYVSKTGLDPMVNITRADARTGSAAKGDKWCQLDFASWCAVEFLFRIEFADWDSQTKVGLGIVNDAAARASGETDSMVYHTGRAAGENGKTAIQYRRIENLWGNVYQWVDGINFNNRRAYICLDRARFADDTTSGYGDSLVSLPVNGWIKGLGASSTFPCAFLPDENGGSNLTYIPDFVYSSTDWRVLCVGGFWAAGLYAGLWSFIANYLSSNASRPLGARLLYNPS